MNTFVLDPYKELYQKELSKLLEQLIDYNLDIREIECIKEYFYNNITLQELSKRFKRHRSTIDIIISKALRKLRRPNKIYNVILNDYCFIKTEKENNNKILKNVENVINKEVLITDNNKINKDKTNDKIIINSDDSPSLKFYKYLRLYPHLAKNNWKYPKEYIEDDFYHYSLVFMPNTENYLYYLKDISKYKESIYKWCQYPVLNNYF
jgi:hypothetical protein